MVQRHCSESCYEALRYSRVKPSYIVDDSGAFAPHELHPVNGVISPRLVPDELKAYAVVEGSVWLRDSASVPSLSYNI